MTLARKLTLLIGGTALAGAGILAALFLGPRPTRPSGVPGHTAPAALSNPDVSTGSSIGDPAAPNFTLRDQNGQLTSLTEFRGKVVVLAFVDSHCTDVCPLMTESMVQALRMLGPAASQVQLLGINANPVATKISDVAAYTRAHHMQRSWRFLTGPLPELKKVWHSYHVYVAAVHDDIDHQPIVVLIDQRGRERKIYAVQMSYEGVLQQAELLGRGISQLLPSHPTLRDAVSLRYIPPLQPTSVLRLAAIGPRTREIVLGKGHPHLLLFFAGWLSESANLPLRLAVLDEYATAARQHEWPPPTAVNELTTESVRHSARRALHMLAAELRTPIVEDAKGRLGDGYGVQDLPSFVLTAPSGRIIWHHDGWLSANKLDKAVSHALSVH